MAACFDPLSNQFKKGLSSFPVQWKPSWKHADKAVTP